MNRTGPVALLTAAIVLLGACTVLPEPRSHDVYRLPPSAIAPADGVAIERSLRVSTPVSQDLLAGSRIAVLSDGNRYNVFGEARWSAPVPTLWRDHLLDAFHNDGRIRRLGSDAELIEADVELGGMLRAFHAERHGGATRVVIRIDAHLVEVRNRRILDVRRFETAEAVDGAGLPGVVTAFGRAGDALAGEMIEWTLRQMDERDE